MYFMNQLQPYLNFSVSNQTYNTIQSFFFLQHLSHSSPTECSSSSYRPLHFWNCSNGLPQWQLIMQHHLQKKKNNPKNPPPSCESDERITWGGHDILKKRERDSQIHFYFSKRMYFNFTVSNLYTKNLLHHRVQQEIREMVCYNHQSPVKIIY